MKYVIIGRCATGKSCLAHLLEENGLTLLRSYTTRPRRSDNDDHHVYITPDEAAAMPDTDKVLSLSMNGYDYFCLKQDVIAADVCILDPNGYKMLCDMMPETSIHVIHVTAEDAAAQLNHVSERSDDPDAAIKEFQARQVTENPLFGAFENNLYNSPDHPDNATIVHPFKNDFQPETVKYQAQMLLQYKTIFDNLMNIAKQNIQMGVLRSDRPGFVPMTYQSNTQTGPDGKPLTYPKEIPLELFVDLWLNDAKLFQHMLTLWLSHPLNLQTLEPTVTAIAEALDLEAANADLSAYGDFADPPEGTAATDTSENAETSDEAQDAQEAAPEEPAEPQVKDKA